VRVEEDLMSKAKYVTSMAMLFALALVLSIMEGMLPPLPYLPPGFKLGLSNIATMYALFFMGKRQAFIIAVLKSAFVLFTRGATSGALSLSGGICSLAVMLVLSCVFKQKISYLLLSIFGAVFHNMGQLAAVTLIMLNRYTLWYAPVLIVAGVVMGCVTGSLLKVVMPALKKISIYKEENRENNSEK
jgi:heptaprenyl diphosphate synthase